MDDHTLLAIAAVTGLVGASGTTVGLAAGALAGWRKLHPNPNRRLRVDVVPGERSFTLAQVRFKDAGLQEPVFVRVRLCGPKGWISDQRCPRPAESPKHALDAVGRERALWLDLRQSSAEDATFAASFWAFPATPLEVLVDAFVEPRRRIARGRFRVGARA